ncbi:retrotransposon protein [Cucumis melo var. makuwa]|uniref:Retrotransposon protein n=1 Tax=Cucumis melo var. makuwa TaxID=1194695 RepID=A0A5D3CVN5_CUCMM|nr:retrotransposon protein [Cucumis melo var. makuwa]TYK15961.1 retrotransposon protein [Cucumis melo var. makuwa]
MDEGGGRHSCRVFSGIGVHGGWKSNNETFRPGYLAQVLHPVAKGLLNKPSSYYDELAYVFSRDRATGRFAEMFIDMGSNKLAEYEGFDIPDGNEEFPSMAGSSGSKRKRGSQREVELDVIHMALECMNDELRTIVEWPACALVNDNHVRQEFFHILHEMTELTSLDRTLLQRHLLSHMDDMRGFVLMPKDERKGFCRVIVRDVSK